MDVDEHAGRLQLTAKIVSAHASRNEVSTEELLALIGAVYAALRSAPGENILRTPDAKPEPAVPIKRSVFPDYLVCLEDGKKLKMLKRHLRTAYNMTVDEYRARWGLPSSYPMVAPNYAEHRSSLARKIGLGRKLTATEAEPLVRQIPEGVSSRRARKSKEAA